MYTFTDYVQDMDCNALALFCGPIVALVICGMLLITKPKNDTLQHSSSKESPSLLLKSHKDSTLNSGEHSQSNRGNSVNTSGKQRKSRCGNKGRNVKSNNTILHAKSNHCHMTLPGFGAKNWFQSDMYFYDRKNMSSAFEDNIAACQFIKQRNSTTIEVVGSEESNSGSSNEELSLTYLEKINQLKKDKIPIQKRQHKRKQHRKSSNNTNVHLMDIHDENKKIIRSSRGKQTSSNAVQSLRKQCTKAAALKAALSNNKLSKTFNHGHSTLESNVSFESSLSSASSTTSINSTISLSASSSPTHSVNSSPTASPMANKRNTESGRKKSLTSPLRQFTKLNMNEQELFQQMRRYVIDPSLLRIYGFPVESLHHEDCVEIYKCLPKHLAEEAVTKDNQRHHRHFYGRKKCEIINDSDDLYSNSFSQKWCAISPADSGHDSGESSPRFTDSDSSEISEEDIISPIMAFYTPDGVYQIFSEYCNSIEKQCVRCFKMFQVNEKGEYLSFDSCTYHWGKLNNVYDGKCYSNIYSCCQGEEFCEGCSKHPLHVWSGVVVGVNGPYTGFLHTQHKDTNHKHSKIYAIDCEMSYTGLGLEVTKVTVVGFDGSLVYEHFVKPQAEIIDFNTRFSGVSEKDFLPNSNSSIKTFAELQKDLLNLFDADTILIGHGLDNDLKVLRLVHKTIVDTSVIFNHSTGYPYRRSLKNLTKSFLKRDIQCGDKGHNSFEDSRACLELMMWRVRKDLRHWNYQ